MSERRHTTTLLGILLLAWAMRVLALDAHPPGMDRDAATNGVYALYILHEGLRPLFYRVGAPEPLIIYLQAISVALLGVSVFALRIVTAMIGTLTIPALYATARVMKLNARIALLASLGLALNVEHVHLSRLGLRAISIPFVVMLLVYFFSRAWRSNRARDFLAAGAVLGAGYYTYLSAIFLPILLAAFIAHHFLFNRATARARWRGIVVTGALALVIAAPLLIFEIIYPNAAFLRASQVTLFQHPDFDRVGLSGVIASKLISQIKMFGIAWEGQYNPLAQPLLDPVWFAFFSIGLLICLRHIRRIEYAWAVLTIVVMLLPDLIGGNEIFPQELRVIGIIPPTFFVSALGLAAAIDWGKRWHAQLARIVAAMLVLWSGVVAYDSYFNRFGKTDDFNFVLGDVTEGKWIARTMQPVYIPLNEYARQPVRYLAGARAPRLRSALDANGNLIAGVIPDRARVMFPLDPARPRFEGRQYAHDPAAFVLVRDDVVYLLPPLEDWEAELRGSAPTEEIPYPFGGTAARVFAVGQPPFATRAAATSPSRFGAEIALLNADLRAPRVEPGGVIPLSLSWRITRRQSEDYAIFIHLLDVEENVIAAADVIPALGAYPTFLWKSDEVIPTQHQLRVPLRTLPGKYHVEIGLYNILNGARLEIVDERGNPTDSRVVIGPIKVAPRQAIAYNPSHAQRVNFDNRITLIGYDAQQTDAREFRVSLYWEALAEMDRDYTLFVHVIDERGAITAQADHQPQGGNYPTSIWDVGENVRDDFALTLPSDASGKYRVLVGWYELKTGERIAVRDAKNQITGDYAALETALEVTR